VACAVPAAGAVFAGADRPRATRVEVLRPPINPPKSEEKKPLPALFSPSLGVSVLPTPLPTLHAPPPAAA
jgi:hypothetical protein